MKLDKYEVVNKISDNEHIKILISTLYDNIIYMTINQILSHVNKKKKITLQYFEKILLHVNNKIIGFLENIDINTTLKENIYTNYIIKLEDKYDIKEDQFPGLIGEIIKLPSAPNKPKEKIPILKIQKFQKPKNIELDEIMEADQYDAICQHNITWDNISALRKKNPNKFSEQLFEFFQQYIIKNYDDDFICKSCGALVNLKNYVQEGTYDDDGRFVSFSMPMDVSIEDIPEYEKYKSTIRNLEKIIERIASISNISSLSGNSTTIKSRIKKIVKDGIDLLLVHNANLKNIYKERSEKISFYGINKELTNLFVFELDNSIFIYSSKDKDQYKPIKRNNIVIYLLFLIILELSDSQLYYMTGDKICNYYLFSKYGINWFSNINIKINNKNKTEPILNYKVFCYIIFYMSCLLTKYGLWYTENKDEKIDVKKKFDPNIQKSILHTLIDFINSILEMYSKKKKHYIYDIIANKFFQKLSTTFKNDEILNRIKIVENKKTNIYADNKKNKIVSNKEKKIILLDKFKEGNYFGYSDWLKYKIAKYFIPKSTYIFNKYYEISNITNCESGIFHNWIIKGNECICSICNLSAKNLNHKHDMKIIYNYNSIQLQKLAKKYCKSGELHNFIFETKSQCNICTNCSKIESDKLTDNELHELSINIIKFKELQTKKIPENIKKIKNHKNFINDIKSKYGKSKEHKEDYYKFIDLFIENIESILGKDLNLDNKNIFLRYDSYIINHDHNGFPINDPFWITDTLNKIIFKKDHPFFKKDVIFYSNHKLQIDVFYDASTKLLLGFKEKNKDFQYSKKSNIYLKINHSISNRIKMLGYTSHFVDIHNYVESFENVFNDKDILLKYIVSDINRERIFRLKKFINDLQRYIYRLAYNYDIKPIDEENNSDLFLEKYKNKLNNIVLYKDNIKFLKNWKVIKYELFFETLENKVINLDKNVKYISNYDLSTYDYTGNVILFYLVNEMIKLLDLNNDNYVKSTLAYLLLDIIIKIHDEFDDEKDLTNTEIKRFKYILDLKDDVNIENFEESVDDENIDDENVQNQLDDDYEEEQGMDMDISEEDYYEIDYSPSVNFDG